MRAVLIPAKRKSKRIPHKNLQKLGDMSLVERCIAKMVRCRNVDQIIVDTDSDEVRDICDRYMVDDSRLKLKERSTELLGDDVGTPQLCVHLLESDESIKYLGVMHSTAPFLQSSTIDQCIETFIAGENQYDSLFTVETLRDYLWKDRPLNFNVDCRTSTDNVDIYHKLTGGFFMSTREYILRAKTFIGKNPVIYPVKVLESLDINYPDELDLARLINEALVARGDEQLGM